MLSCNFDGGVAAGQKLREQRRGRRRPVPPRLVLCPKARCKQHPPSTTPPPPAPPTRVASYGVNEWSWGLKGEGGGGGGEGQQAKAAEPQRRLKAAPLGAAVGNEESTRGRERKWGSPQRARSMGQHKG